MATGTSITSPPPPPPSSSSSAAAAAAVERVMYTRSSVIASRDRLISWQPALSGGECCRHPGRPRPAPRPTNSTELLLLLLLLPPPLDRRRHRPVPVVSGRELWPRVACRSSVHETKDRKQRDKNLFGWRWRGRERARSIAVICLRAQSVDRRLSARRDHSTRPDSLCRVRQSVGTHPDSTVLTSDSR